VTPLARARALLAPHPDDSDPHADETRLLHASELRLLDEGPAVIADLVAEVERLQSRGLGPRKSRAKPPPIRRL
jgi:hypothetical protein